VQRRSLFFLRIYTFRPNRPYSGVQAVAIKDSAAHCSAVFIPPIAVASGYFGYVGYNQFYLFLGYTWLLLVFLVVAALNILSVHLKMAS
jgi:hypothetical protein